MSHPMTLQYDDVRSTESTSESPTLDIMWSSYDSRSINPLLTIDERNYVHRSIAVVREKQNDVRQAIEKAEAELRTLLVQQDTITNDVLQLQKRLVIHRILPREIIGYIFSILCAEKLSIPHEEDKIVPPQIAVSHVCSKWREIALATPSLWTDVELTRPSDDWVEVAIEHLFNRAGTRWVNLALDITHWEISLDKMKKIVYDIVLPLHVKKLHLALPLSALEKLSQHSDLIITNIDEIALSLTSHSELVPFAPNSNQVSIAPQFLRKITSMTVFPLHGQDTLVQRLDLKNFPWGQIRYLCCNVALTLSTIYDILRQSPLLNVCGIRIKQDDGAEPTTVLTLPQLQIFHIRIVAHIDQNKVLWCFKCPNLTDFRFEISPWTPETYKIIQNHYNLHRLLRFETSVFPFPISKLLSDAPMLEELLLGMKILVDEKASQGIASGELGRCLTSLWFSGTGNFNVKKMLNILISRQRHVKQVVEASRSWRDQHISGIKWIFLWNKDVHDYDAPEELEEELEKLGIIVYRFAYSVEPVYSHPLSSLFKI